MKYQAFALLLLAPLLGGCFGNDTKPATVLEGECKLNHTPEFAVLGKRNYDQRWINRTTEGLVVGCGQPRPKVRPAELDAALAVVRASASVPVPRAAPEPKVVDSPRLNSEPAPVPKQRDVSPLVRPVVRDRQPLWERLKEIWRRK